MLIQEEERKREAYRVCFSSFSLIELISFFQIENLRRRHNWLPFIVELMKAYATQGSLTNAVDKVRY